MAFDGENTFVGKRPIPPVEGNEGEPKKIQLLYDPARFGESAFLRKKWTAAELAKPNQSGYSKQHGTYIEVGMFDSMDQVLAKQKELEG